MDKPILIIDNNPEYLGQLGASLRQHGLSVEGVTDSLAALDTVADRKPEVVVIDLVMPFIGGDTLCRILRSRPDGQPACLVLLSETACEEEFDFRRCGADACIAKGPIAQTVAHVLTVLDHWQHGTMAAINNLVLGKERLYKRQITKELLAAKRQMETIFHNMTEGVLETTPDGRIIYANRAALRLIDVAEEQLLATPVFDLFAAGHREGLRTLLADGQHGAERLGPEKALILRGRPVELSYLPVLEDGYRYCTLFLRDLTAQNETAHALQESEAQYRDLFESAHDIIQMVRPDGKLLFVNNSWLRTFGYTREEVTNLTLSDLIAPDCAEHCANTFQQILTQGEVSDIATTFLTKDGRKVLLEGAANCKLVDSKPERVRCIFRNVTEKKELEHQLLQSQKMQAIGTLAGGIAHDFNNILTSILGFTQLLLAQIPPQSEHREPLLHIMASSRRAAELVQQILTFSRKTKPEPKPLHLLPLVKESLRLLRQTLPPNIDIVQEGTTETQPVLADATQMHQVIMNLCTNAYHAMRDKGGTLTVALEEVSVNRHLAAKIDPALRDTRCVRLTVRDTGHGIHPTILGRIFEPYFSTKPQGEGSGLGLAITHGIVKNHGGDIAVQSKVGKGTRVEVYLPVHAGVAEAPQEETVSGLPSFEGSRLLFVDDEPEIDHLFEVAFTAAGCQVKTAGNAEEALALFRRAPCDYDLVVTDQSMPGMTGLELAAALLALREELPVILCTGDYDLTMEEAAKAVGVREVLRKPLHLDRLMAIIKKHLLVHQAA